VRFVFRIGCFLGFVTLAAVFPPANAADRGPFADAVAVWHMADLTDSAGKQSALTAHGDVRLGVALTVAEREASLRRGGDGRAAEFRGGRLEAGQGADGELNLAGKAMTMCMRLRDPSGKWDSPLFSKHGGHSKLTFNLFSANLGKGMVLGFELGTDFRDRPLQLTAPINMIGPADWHDVVVRYQGPTLELFVDGVLVDEEWPAGSLRRGNTEPCLIGAESYGGRVKSGFHGMVDHAALWHRALSDAEIATLSGGNDAIAKRRTEILGEPNPSMQYWRPPGHNTNVGDCMPFYHDGTFHLFYLFDRRHHGSKFGLGAHQWAHASTKDLVHWTHHPLAIPITEEREASICTGSVFFHDGTCYGYYATRMADGSGERLSLATSADGIHFQKTEPNPFAGPEKGYGPRDYRDPNVFRDEGTGLFHMLVAARLADARGGCLAQLISTNLRNWKLGEPFLVTGYVPECPDHFAWNGWHYLMSTGYWMSRGPLGPWTKPKVNALDVLYVPKTAAFTGNRRIWVSWLPDGGWGGCAVFREVIQHADGTLGTRFPPEMIPKHGPRAELSVEAPGSSAAEPGGRIELNASKGPEEVILRGLPHNARIALRFKAAAGAAAFGLRMRGSPLDRAANELRFVAPQRQVQIAGGPSLQEFDITDRPLSVEIILKDDILDVCLDGRRTLVSRVANLRGDRLVLFAEKGTVAFDGLGIYALQ